MAKLLHLSRPSRRVSNVVRVWLALRRQKRRRQRAVVPGEVPAAPSIWLEDRADNIVVHWDAHSTNQLGFRVYRLGAGLFMTVGADVSEVADYSVEFGNYYEYYVVAYNAAGESAPSNSAGLTVGG